MEKKIMRLNLILCSVLHGLNHYLLIFFKPMYPQMAEYFSLTSVAEVTTRLTIAYVGYGLANFLTGLAARRVSLKYVLFAGMLVMSLSAAALAFVPPQAYGAAVFFAFLMGLGGGTYHPAANTLMTSLYETRPGHAIGILSIGSAVGFTAAPLIGTHLGRGILGFQSLFLISGAVAFAYAWLFFIALPGVPPPGQKPEAARGAPAVPGHGRLAVFIILLAVPAVVRDVINWGYFEVTPYWVEHGFSQGIGVDWIQLMAYLPGLAIQPLAGKLCDRIGSFTLVTATFLITSAGYLLFTVNSAPVVWIALVLYGTGLSGATVANETYIASLVRPRDRGLVYGIVLSLALGLGGYLGGASGWIVDLFGKADRSGYQIWFVGMGALNALSVICFLVIERLRKAGRG